MILNVLLIITIPLVGAIACLCVPNRGRGVKETIAVVVTSATLFFAASIFGKEASCSIPWAGFGMELAFRVYHFSSFIVVSAALFAFLVALYSVAFMGGAKHRRQFYAYYLISLSFACGAVLSDNLVAMLFFWEGLLGAIFGMITIGMKGAFRTATKAFIIIGVSDLCLMAGIAVASRLSGTFAISEIQLHSGGLASIAFLLLMIGAIGKAGSMPFHSWIPDAATDAPLPFMALVPAAFEKLLGIYFLTRITLDMFKLEASSKLSMLLMIIGAVTIVLAVMMALIQKNYKRLLSYHAISQVGYMILGIGTCVPAGIIGGLFHMINNVMYKSCLFLTGGAVEKQAGTSDLDRLGGLARHMPVTFACFVITAASISGVPPFNGFFSKELVYEGALERGWIFYAAALVGSFLTAASFLKLGHAAFLGRPDNEREAVKEAPLMMLAPMIVISFLCVLFGLWNALPIDNLIQPVLGEMHLEGHSFSGMPKNMLLTGATILVLLAALVNHIYGARKTGKGLGAVDHIHYAPGLHQAYDMAERKVFDPYVIGLRVTTFVANIARIADRVNDWIYNELAPAVALGFGDIVKKAHDGKYKTYIMWSLVGFFAVIYLFVR